MNIMFDTGESRPAAGAWRRISAAAVALSAICAALVLGGPAGAQSSMIAADQGVPGLVILPVTNSAGPDYDAAATNLTAGIKLRLNAVGMFHAPSFPANRLDLLPSVQRAINVDMTLTPEDLTLPITDPATGQKISKAIGTPYFVLGTLNTVTTNPNKSVQVAATIQLFNTQTGASLLKDDVTGNASPSFSNEDQSAVSQRAFDNAAGKAVALIDTAAPSQAHSSAIPPYQKQHASSSSTGILLVLAGILAAVVIHNIGSSSSSGSSSSNAGSGSSSGGGGTTSGPPSPPGNLIRSR